MINITRDVISSRTVNVSYADFVRKYLIAVDFDAQNRNNLLFYTNSLLNEHSLSFVCERKATNAQEIVAWFADGELDKIINFLENT